MSSSLVAFSVALTCQRLLVLFYLLNSFKATGISIQYYLREQVQLYISMQLS